MANVAKDAVLQVRLPREDADRFAVRCALDGEAVSAVLRRWIYQHLRAVDERVAAAAAVGVVLEPPERPESVARVVEGSLERGRSAPRVGTERVAGMSRKQRREAERERAKAVKRGE